jgi:hypothetical protein
MNKEKNIMIINIIGLKVKKIKKVQRMKDICYHYGDSQMKNKERKMLLLFVGILDILIYLLLDLEVMTS